MCQGEESHASKKTVGIIGGMGPAATAEFYHRIVRLTDADKDQDHVPVMMISEPRIPDRTTSINEGKNDFSKKLITEARTLALLGCSILAMPCNTAHAVASEIAQEVISTEMIDMPFETLKLISELGFSHAGLMATCGTIEAGVYQQRSKDLDVKITIPSPAAQNALAEEIYSAIKAGKPGNKSCIEIAEAEFMSQGCDCSIIACTELSLLAEDLPQRDGLTRFDAMDVLAWQCVRASGSKAKDLVARYWNE